MHHLQGLHVKVIGSQAHGGTPWLGVDPIVITCPNNKFNSDNYFKRIRA